MEEDKKETKDEKPAEDKILREVEKPEKTLAIPLSSILTEEEIADEEEKKAKAEKELAEKEAVLKAEKEKKAKDEKEAIEKAEKEAKAEADKKKANKKRAKKKKKAVKKADNPKRIRMLMSIANEKISYTAGDVYEVGKDITLDDAKKRLREGVAELDVAIEGPSETK